MEAATLSAGSIILATECLVPSAGSDDFDDDELEHARVAVPKEGSLHFPAAFYSLSKHSLKMVTPIDLIAIKSDPVAVAATLHSA